jgi:hypothetical protein
MQDKNNKKMNEEDARQEVSDFQKKLLGFLQDDSAYLETLLNRLGNNRNPHYDDLVEIVRLNATITTVLSAFVLKHAMESITKEELDAEMASMVSSMYAKREE